MGDEPTLLFCVGAAKSGTTWLYRYLHDHPECHLRSIKELHFFDTVDFDDYDQQFGVLDRLRADLLAKQADLSGWHRQNVQRQIDDADEIRGVIGQGAAGQAAYLEYLWRGFDADKQLMVADITPGYAILSQDRLHHMAALPGARFLYIMRDPVERLWSHVRMQAVRNRQPGEEVPIKSRRIMNRVVNRGMETHIPARGDYRNTVQKLMAAVPAARLLIDFTETLLSETGLQRLCRFLGIEYRAADFERRRHRGADVPLPDKLRHDASVFLAPQYDFVERTFGALPKAWQANMVRV